MPSIPGNPRELYRKFKSGGWVHTDFAVPAWMGDVWAIVARALEPTKEGGKPQVEFRYVAHTGMSNPNDGMALSEIKRRVQMTASILDQVRQAE